MGRRKDYMPTRDADFFTFQRHLIDKAEANKAAWGIADSAVDALAVRRDEYEPLYHKAQNKGKRTMGDVLAHRYCRRTYEKEIRAFVRKYDGFIPDTGKSLIGLTIRDTEPSPRPAISDIPAPFLKPLGGGTIKVTCKRTTDQDRPSIHRDADAIECRYIFIPKGEMPPKSWEDCSKIQTSKKARFYIDCGDKNSGHSFYGFFRWVNLTDPDRSGPWSKTRSVVIA